MFGRNGIARYSRELLSAVMKNEAVTQHFVGTRNQIDELTQWYGDVPKHAELVLTHERALGAPFRRLVRVWKARQIRELFDCDDVVHYLGPQKIFANHRKVVSTIHDLIPLYDEYAVDAGLRHRFPKMIAKQLHHSSAIVCPSSWVASTVRERFPWFNGSIHVTPLAAGNQFTPTPADRSVREKYRLTPSYLIFVGRIDVARKNLDVILKAWLTLPKDIRSETSFVVVTDNSHEAIKHFLNKHGITPDASLQFHTSVTTHELVQMLSSARGMVFASQAEGFGLPIVEAMKCGCPVITSNTTSMPEVGGSAATYVDPRNIDQLRDAMIQLLLNDDMYTSMQAAGLHRSKEFSWSTTAELTINAYMSCIKQ